jgi:Rps23 Pro-64 3,4-dihydroxylase Tpa1-like proline 4-hydroxylase
MFNTAVFENILPLALWSQLSDYFTNTATFRYGWASDKRVSEFTHWHIDFLNKSGANQDNAEQILYRRPEFSVIAAVWTYLKSEHLAGHALVRCYANAHTYGVEGYPHPDSLKEGNYTTILYVVPEWKSEWAGETVFLNDVGDIVKSCLPKPNRAILFDGQQVHSARSVARICPGLRVTLMFKTKAPELVESSALAA